MDRIARRDQVPRRLTTELVEQADVVVTMDRGDGCPYIGVAALADELD